MAGAAAVLIRLRRWVSFRCTLAGDLAWGGLVTLIYGAIAGHVVNSMPEGWRWFAHVNQLVDGANFWSVAGGYLGHPLWHPSSATALWQQRLLYPALAAFLTGGVPEALPATLVIVNVGAAGLVTASVATVLRRSSLPQWPALGLTLSAGGIVVLLSDVADLVLVAFVAAGWSFWRRRQIVFAVALLSLAVLAKETAWLFVLPAAAAEARAQRWGASAALAGAAFAAYSVAFAANQWRFGGLVPYAAVQQTVTWPFAGLWPLGAPVPLAWAAYAWICYVLPIVGLAARAVARRPIGAAGSALVANALLFVSLAPSSWSSPIHFTRLALPVWLAAALWLADRRSRGGTVAVGLIGPVSLLGYALVLGASTG